MTSTHSSGGPQRVGIGITVAQAVGVGVSVSMAAPGVAGSSDVGDAVNVGPGVDVIGGNVG